MLSAWIRRRRWLLPVPGRFPLVGAETQLNMSGVAVAHFTTFSISTLNIQASFCLVKNIFPQGIPGYRDSVGRITPRPIRWFENTGVRLSERPV